ncbi:MAG: FAD-dependent oxidoreductase [Anaerolineae bacterium]|nr:FAD-dependent oxidoreductase [Anaerolineae bacterium]
MNNKTSPRILVLGGGFGGLETAFYLRMRLGNWADITVISDRDSFFFKPNSIYIPFGLDAERLKIELDGPMKRRNIRFIQTQAHQIDSINKIVYTDADKYPFDFLVVATGANTYPEEIPGLEEYGHDIWTPQGMMSLRGAFEDLAREASVSHPKRVLFMVPPNNKHAGPLYEMAFLFDSWLNKNNHHGGIDIVWTTYEKDYLQDFGNRFDPIITEEFERRNITAYKDYEVERVEPKEVVYKNGQSVTYDLLVSFPPYVASTPFLGLPSDPRGFVTTYQESRRVIECPRIYAVGDITNFPVKQAYLAVLQADAAAEHIAAEILDTEPKIKYNHPVSMYVLDEVDTAIFAQIPLEVKNFYQQTAEVNEADPEAYRVGTSPVWHYGKKLLGLYLPQRFRAGKPLHSGLTWQGMEAGLKVISQVLSS